MNTIKIIAFIFGLLVAGVFVGWLAWPHITRRIFGEGPKV